MLVLDSLRATFPGIAQSPDLDLWVATSFRTLEPGRSPDGPLLLAALQLLAKSFGDESAALARRHRAPEVCYQRFLEGHIESYHFRPYCTHF